VANAMRSTLRSRLEKLEARQYAVTATITRYGLVALLPADFVGERHIVMVNRAVNASPNEEWCHFEERPGPGANEAEGARVIYLSEVDRRL